MSKRFYHIAYELRLPPRAFIRELAEVGLSVGNQMVIVGPELEERIRSLHADLHAPPEPEPAEAEAPAEPVEAAEAAEPDEAPEEAPAEDEGVQAEPEPAEVATASAEETADASPVATAEEVAEAPTPAEAAGVAPAGGERVEVAARGDAPATEGKAPAKETAPKDFVPGIDPRAGRLVKDAPRGGVPGVTTPKRSGDKVDFTDLNPTIPQSDRAPGARRESGRRSSVPERFRGKRGKETFHMRRRPRKSRQQPDRPRPTAFEVEPPVRVKEFGELSAYKAAEIVKILFTKHNMVVTPNDMLDQDTLELLALELDLDLTFKQKETAEDVLQSRVEQSDEAGDLEARPPVVTILGHVDHGKTTLLDKIRSTDVAAKEAGGITQHIGASQVKLPDGRRVTFIDTPGHEAFTEMRARGAQVTDVVILIIAADDGVMPQTEEAISHARAAGVPMIVAITKVDKEGADPTRVKQQLSEHEVFVEGYGGDVSAFEVSGITGQGVDDLLEHLALLAEVEAERFRANPGRMAEGVIIESANNPQRGRVATVLIQNGTLERGDPVLAGEAWGTVRAMFDYLGNDVESARPGDPVEVIGLDQPPEVGSHLYEMESGNAARQIVERRRSEARERELAAQSKPRTIDALLGAIDEGKIQELNVVLKADVKGSLEPVRGLLERMGTEEVRVKVIHSAVGAVNESDVILASASDAWILSFNVNIDEKARAKAKMLGVEIRQYEVIYDIEKDVRAALEGKLAPEQREVYLGQAEVLQVFSSSRLGNIAGCRVRDGVIRRDARIRVKRGGEVLADTRLASLRREKDEAREVKEGFECGIRVDGFDAFEAGDELEAYTVEEVARTLE